MEYGIEMPDGAVFPLEPDPHETDFDMLVTAVNAGGLLVVRENEDEGWVLY